MSNYKAQGISSTILNKTWADFSHFCVFHCLIKPIDFLYFKLYTI